MADISILVPAVATVPTGFTIAGSQEIVLKGVTASYDGTGAGGPFIPAVQIVDPSGHITGTYTLGQTLAAGASADISWFPGVSASTAAAGNTIGFEHNDALVAIEENADFEDSASVTWTLTDDAANNRVKISAAAAGGGGSPGSGNRASYTGSGTTDVTLGNIHLDFSNLATGVQLFDITDPTVPLALNDGFYTMTVNAKCTTNVSASRFFTIEMDMDTNNDDVFDFAQFVLQDDAGGGAHTPGGDLTMGYFIPATSGVDAAILVDPAQGQLTFDYEIVVMYVAGSLGSGGIRFGIDNVDGVSDPGLEIETGQFVSHAFSLPAAIGVDSAVNYGEAHNNQNGALFTGPTDAFANSGNANVTILALATSGDNGQLALNIAASDTTAAGTQATQGVQVQATSASTHQVVGGSFNAFGQSSGDAYGLQVEGTNTGTGREIGLLAEAAGHQTGAKSLAILCQSHTGTPIFEVRDDGSVHILTGTSVIADL